MLPKTTVALKQCVKKARSALLYLGLEKEDYNRIRPMLAEDSRKRLRFIMLASFFVISALIVLCLIAPKVFFSDKLWYYFVLLCALIPAFILLNFKSNMLLTYLGELIFLESCMLFAAIIGVVGQEEEACTTFIAFLIALPLLVNWRPMKMLFFILFNALFYIIITSIYKIPSAARVDVFHTTIFAIISFIDYMHYCKTKSTNFLYYQNALTLSETDWLTGLYNGTHYDLKLEEYNNRIKNESLGVFVFDLDNLKKINDKYGHLEGNKIIRLASSCISDTFSAFGDCYRLGGDEFLAVVSLDEISCSELYERFCNAVNELGSKTKDEFGISCGFVDSLEFENADMRCLVEAADNKMYDKKRIHHLQDAQHK